MERMERCKAAYEAAVDILGTGGVGLERLRSEYDKMWSALEESNESSGQLQSKALELEGEVLSQSELVSRAKAEEEAQGLDKKVVQEDIENNQREVGQQKQTHREQEHRIEELSSELAALQKTLKGHEGGNGWTVEQETQLAQLRKKEADLEHFLEQKQTKLQGSRSDVEALRETVREGEDSKAQLEGEVAALQGETEAIERACKKAQMRRDRVDGDLRALKAEVERLNMELHGKVKRTGESGEELRVLEDKLAGAKEQMEEYLKEYDALFQTTKKLTDAMDDQARINLFLGGELEKREGELLVKQGETKSVRKDSDRLKRVSEHANKRIEESEEQREAAERKRVEVKDNTKVIEVEIKAARKENETMQRQMDDLVKEREILNKTLVNAEERTKQVHDLIAAYKNTERNLENEVNGYKADAIRQRQGIELLEDDVTKYEQESASENQKYLNAVEEVKLQDARLGELQRRIHDGETKLKQQQNLYEAVRSDRNLYSKNLIDAQEEIAEMKRKFKIMNHQIEQLKEEITGKDHSLVKEHFDHHKVEKDKELLRNELAKIRKQTQSSEQIISNQETEVHKLAHIMHDAEEEHARQQKEYQAIIAERDILGSQLVKRNDELSKLYERIKMQMSGLRKGQFEFDGKIKVLHDLKHSVTSLQRERTKLADQVQGIPALDADVIRLEREIAQERSKVKALTDEMERPLNVHRWRKLESSDPERFALIKAIQAIQAKLIETTERVQNNAELIREKEALYVQLKTVLARQPGPEVAEQLALYQQNLKDKHAQINQMNAQLHKHRAQVQSYRADIDALQEAMGGLKRGYIKKQKKRLLARQRNDAQSDSDSDSDSSGSSESSGSDSDSDSDDDLSEAAPPTNVKSTIKPVAENI